MNLAKMERVVGPRAAFKPFRRERKKTKCLTTSGTQKRESMSPLEGVMSTQKLANN
jgi:hypothetical protein